MGTCGVYEIQNTESGKRYVGSLINMESRFVRHRYQLKKGTHGNRHLQRSWNKYGRSAFSFRILIVCPSEDRFQEEQHLLDSGPWEALYNMARDASRGAGRWGRLGKKNTPEHNQKIREAHLGKPSPRKGKTHDWGGKIRESLNRSHPDVKATHLNGEERVFPSTIQAAQVLGLKRKTVSNILNGLAKRTRCGWVFERVGG